MSVSRPYDNVFEALEDDAAEADSLRIRSEMMIRLRDHIARKGFSQEEAARTMCVTEDSVNSLLNGKIDRFTIDMLVGMLSHAGIRAEFVLSEAA